MKYITAAILLLLSFNSFSKVNLAMESFGKIPILHEGRVKPLDTFARTNLLMVYEKSKLKELSAIEWLAELIFDPNVAYKRRIFKIRNSDTVKALSLTADKTHNYTFIEVSTAINNESKLISEISNIEKKLRSPTQQQIFELYYKVSTIFEISRSVSLIIPQFKIPSKDYAQKLDLPFGTSLTYLQVLKRKAIFEKLAGKIYENTNGFAPQEHALLALGRSLEVVASDTYTKIFRIVPPQVGNKIDSEWHSPWQTVQGGHGNPLTAKYFEKWAKMYTAYMAKDIDAFEEFSLSVYESSKELSKQVVNSKKLDWEFNYSKWDLFTKSVTLYILAFLLLCFSWLFWKKILEKVSFALMSFGGVLHGLNLTLRCIIMDRPPVTTLYESIIFVAFICIFGAILIERKRKDGLGTFVGTTLGTILLFVSFGYEKDGDSMGMLAAVLDTNFWLATHVVTITIGYGCAFVSSILAHVYLFQKYIKYQRSDVSFDIKDTLKNMHGSVLFALFFTVLGTILGGIWADQSWGRFWGWDPKENGAMLICMWLLWVVHGNLTKYFKDIEYAFLTALTSIIVVLAWFGVNLLNVGLHSYGFTESIATNIALFTIIELVVCGGIYGVLKFQKKELSGN
ncbi:cytochrome c biogenesis protein [Halobacteriovorax sp. HLS]|uniref:cytochrome c biogenesis protein n=1 Tax=Halobacteriovorax sp. HLS TaxID=2234000 RepID=UPI000FD7DEA9|nr:cytochrome c biogenesis protein CcsA [Halobacteriovorax sp. HLS]